MAAAIFGPRQSRRYDG